MPEAGTLAGAAAQGLAAALRLDPTLAAEPARLRRALADLAPDDERGGLLLALGADVGVPALVTGGAFAEAYARLTDLCGCRGDAARWTVESWAASLSPAPDADNPPAGLPDPAVAADQEADPGDLPAALAEQPGLPVALRMAVRDDGALVLAITTTRGMFLLDGASTPARGRWRRVAEPTAPHSRDIAVSTVPAPGVVVWTSPDGVHARALRAGAGAGRAALGPPWQLAAPPDGEQARYPLAVLGTADGTLAVLWTSDRRELRLTESRPWGSPSGLAPLPDPCTEGERLGGLDWVLETERTAWLLCRTDRGRLLVAPWDLSSGEGGSWQSTDPPRPPVASAIACLGGRPVAIAATASGDLLSLDVRGARDGLAEWHSIDRPGEIRQAAPYRGIAVAAPRGQPAGPGWLALAGRASLWTVPVTLAGGIVACGAPVPVWTGE